MAAFRLLPFVAFAIASKHIGWTSKLLCLAALGTVCMIERVSAAVLGMAAPLAYFVAVSVAIHFAARARIELRLGRVPLFGALCAICMIGPGLSFENSTTAMLLGWETLLSGYSYILDSRKMRASPSVSDGLFFLLVNPTLAFPESGQRYTGATPIARGVLRTLFGIATWAAQDFVEAARWRIFPGEPTPSIDKLGGLGLLHFFGVYSLSFLAFYFAHSGLASIRIGLMMLARYQVPESYRFPLGSVSPQDFWQRWNGWTGAWVRRYIFFPAALGVRRRFRRNGSMSSALTLVGTFAAVGLLHDIPVLVAVALDGSAPLRVPKGIVFFSASGTFLLLSLALLRMRRRLSKPHLRVPHLFLSLVGGVATFASLFLGHSVAKWLSALGS